MIATVIVIALLALLILTDPDTPDAKPPRRDRDADRRAGFRG